MTCVYTGDLYGKYKGSCFDYGVAKMIEVRGLKKSVIWAYEQRMARDRGGVYSIKFGHPKSWTVHGEALNS